VTDRATFLAFKKRVQLIPLVERDRILLNIYSSSSRTRPSSRDSTRPAGRPSPTSWYLKEIQEVIRRTGWTSSGSALLPGCWQARGRVCRNKPPGSAAAGSQRSFNDDGAPHPDACGRPPGMGWGRDWDSMRNRVVIRGGNDIASTVAHRLFSSRVSCRDLGGGATPQLRRGMAYAGGNLRGATDLQG